MAVIRKLRAEVLDIWQHGDGVRTYVTKVDGRMPRFAPGQFLHLAIDSYDPSQQWPESRVFSIASSPDADVIRITVSVQGEFTERMARELRIGSEVWLKLPYGDFTFKRQAAPLVLVAGGTGVAPFISFLEQALETPPESSSIRLYCGVPKQENLIYGEIFGRCAARLNGFEQILYVEQGAVLPQRSGVLDIDAIFSENSDENTVFYLSGPWAMIDSFRTRLLERCTDEDRVRIDDWGY